jgi:hypothetical protein
MKIKTAAFLLCFIFIFSYSRSQDLKDLKSNYELKIELPKYTYKKFEPVKLKIEMINHDSIPLELWGNFEPPIYLTDVEVTDEHGNVFSVNQSHSHMDIMLTAPTDIILPGDTLILSMSINDWGKEAGFVSQKNNDIYFGNRGYFEKGIYTANISTGVNTNSERNIRGKIKPDTSLQLNNGVEIKSNDVNFEVAELNDTDREIINHFKEADFLYNIKPYKDIIDKFPDNTFTEITYVYYLGGKYLNHYRDKSYKYINELNDDYENFIVKYPNSLYLLDFRVVEPYIYRYFIDINTNMQKDDFEQLYTDFKNQNKNNMLKYFLKNKRRVKMILHLEK